MDMTFLLQPNLQIKKPIVGQLYRVSEANILYLVVNIYDNPGYVDAMDVLTTRMLNHCWFGNGVDWIEQSTESSTI